jgi:hypothetical protein
MGQLDNLVAWRLMGEQQARESAQREAEQRNFSQLLAISQDNEAKKAAEFERSLKVAQLRGQQATALGTQAPQYTDARLNESATIGANDALIAKNAEDTAQTRKLDAEKRELSRAKDIAQFNSGLRADEAEQTFEREYQLFDEGNRLKWALAQLGDKTDHERIWASTNSATRKMQDPMKVNNRFYIEAQQLASELQRLQADALNRGDPSFEDKKTEFQNQLADLRKQMYAQAWVNYAANPDMFFRPGLQLDAETQGRVDTINGVTPGTGVPPPLQSDVQPQQSSAAFSFSNQRSVPTNTSDPALAEPDTNAIIDALSQGRK